MGADNRREAREDREVPQRLGDGAARRHRRYQAHRVGLPGCDSGAVRERRERPPDDQQQRLRHPGTPHQGLRRVAA